MKIGKNAVRASEIIGGVFLTWLIEGLFPKLHQFLNTKITTMITEIHFTNWQVLSGTIGLIALTVYFLIEFIKQKRIVWNYCSQQMDEGKLW